MPFLPREFNSRLGCFHTPSDPSTASTPLNRGKDNVSSVTTLAYLPPFHFQANSPLAIPTPSHVELQPGWTQVFMSPSPERPLSHLQVLAKTLLSQQEILMQY